MSNKEDKTINFYDKNANWWLETHDEGDWKETYLSWFKKYLPEGKLFEVGCGAGREAGVLGENYEYMGTDAAGGMIDLAKKRYPELRFEKQNVYNLDLEDKPFDGFWALAVLLHIPKERVDEAFSGIKKNLKKGGLGFLVLKEGDGEVLEDDGRTFVLYKEDEFREVLKRNGFEVLDFKYWPKSERTRWLIFVVKLNE